MQDNLLPEEGFIFVPQKTMSLLVGFLGQPELRGWETELSPTSLRIRWD